MKVDYIIRNGRVMDPLTGVDEVRDVAVCGSRIVDLGGEIAEPRWAEIDAAGCIVTPGLIDFHTHLYHEGSGICIRPDFMLPYGTTAAVDAGSAGCANMRAFFHTAADPSAVKIKAYMTVFSGGQIDGNIIEDFSPSKFNEALIRRVYEKFPHRILGLKIRISKGVVEDAEPLRATVALADKIGGGMGVCVHTTNSPVPAGEIADMLRPGDVFCHCFQGAGNTIVGSDGKIDPAVLAARERGVIFDAANGRGNFGFKAALAALDAGFLPDIISTDLTNDKFNMPYYCKNLPTLMSKYLAMGLDLMTVLRCATSAPAKVMGMEGKIGTLKAGAYADIAIFKEKDIRVVHRDFQNDELVSDKLLVPQLTMASGEILYCSNEFYNG